MSESEHTGAGGLATLLLAARRSGVPAGDVPTALVPADVVAAYEVQDRVAEALKEQLGPIGGWKVGAPTPEGEPFAAPVHAGTIYADGAVVPADRMRLIGAEAEIAYRFGKALPTRVEPYGEGEVLEAVASVHAAIEGVDTRFEAMNSQEKFVHFADQMNHGAMIIGPAVTDWRGLVPVEQAVEMVIDGKVVVAHRGGNSAGDPRRLLVWLANEASRRGYGIPEGTVVITGSMTGTEFVPHGTDVTARFPGFSEVSARFA